jgi:hypothetical protein
MRYIGLDVHREFCEVAISEEGKVCSAGRVGLPREQASGAGPAAWWSIVEGRMPDANECYGISRHARVSIGTSTPQRLAGAAGLGWSVVATRAAGRPMCATCRALRTDHTARRLETGSSLLQRHPLSLRVPLTACLAARRQQTLRSRLTGQLDPHASEELVAHW